MNVVRLGPEYFPEAFKNRPVANGEIYVGIPDLDPEIVANQRQLYVQQEDGTIVAVAQPIYTSAGGIPVYSGSPVTLLVNGDYSLKVNNKHGAQVYYVPLTSSSGETGATCSPDYNAADQGILGDSNTVKACVDKIGATNKGTILLKHDSGGEYTDYVFSTDETIPSNIFLKIEPGARLNIALGVTLTIYSPANIIAQPNQQIFSGDGFIKFSGEGDIIYVHWWGAKGDGVTDNTDAFQAAINAASYCSGTIKIPAGIYEYTTLYTYYDATYNPNFISYNYPSLLIQGAGCIHANLFTTDDGGNENLIYYRRTSNIGGTVLRSTVTTGNAFCIGRGTPFADRKQTGKQVIRDISFFGETTGVTVYVGYSQQGFLMEDCFVGLLQDVAGTAMLINNAWGSQFRRVWVKSGTSNTNVAAGTANSIGIDLDIYEEGSVSPSFLSGGNFQFDMVNVDHFKYGWKIHGYNVILTNCGDVKCYVGLWCDLNIVLSIYNYYCEYDFNIGMYFPSGENVLVSGLYADFEYIATAGILIGNPAHTYYMSNIKLENMYIRNSGKNGGKTIQRYYNSTGVEISNNRVGMYADPFIDTEIVGPTNLTRAYNNEFFAAGGSGWVLDYWHLVEEKGASLADFSNYVNWTKGEEGVFSGVGVYDFSVDGGDFSEDSPYELGWIPIKATVIEAYYEVLTTLTSATDAATIALGVETNDPNGIVAPTAISAVGNIWDAGYHDTLCDSTMANVTAKTTHARKIIMTVANEDITAGKIRVYWKYIMSQ